MALTVTQIQQLYTAYLGRAVDQEGVDYWTDAELDLTVADLRFNLANENQPEYVELYGNLSREDLVKAIYQNMFNRPADDNGLAYWTTGEGSVVPANELQQLFIEAASDEDKAAFEAEVQADLEEYEAGDTSELTEALETYQAAVAAERAFLEAATENEAVLAVDDESTNAEIETAIDTAVGTASTGVVNELNALNTALGGTTKFADYATSFANASAAVKAEIIAEAQAEAAKEVESAQDQVGKISGQLSKVNALVSAKAAYEAALEAAPKALTTLNAEINKFDTLNTAAATATYTPADPSTTPATAVNYVVSDGTGEIIKLENGRLVVTTEGQSAEGIDALLAAAQADYQAKLAVDAGKTNFEARLVSAYNGEVDTDIAVADLAVGNYYSEANNEVTLASDFTSNASDSAALLAARGVEAELNEAISDYQAVATVAADLATLQSDVEDAADAIEELGYELAEVTAGASAGTDADDLFVYGETELDVSGFGLEGNDLLFIGEGFSEVRVDAGDDAVSDRLGSSSELEVFFQQDGNNALIYVEEEAFGGNATNPNDLTKITLAGVNIEDLQFENGYVSVVEVA